MATRTTTGRARPITDTEMEQVHQFLGQLHEMIGSLQVYVTKANFEISASRYGELDEALGTVVLTWNDEAETTEITFMPRVIG